MMYAAMQHPQVERRQNYWCPGMTPAPLGLSLPALDPAAAPHASELPSEIRALRIIIEQAAAHAFDIEPELLSFPSRGRARTALARQVAMYIAHVGLSLSLTQVGQLFDRDRTTVAHACEVVEQRRDDVAFDRAITLLERVIRIICGTTGRRNGATMPPPSAWPDSFTSTTTYREVA
jgi:Bacterial dnaA protein helix-turn-helix